MAITATDLEHWFTYHAPKKEDLSKYDVIRNAGRAFAQAIINNSPPSADQTTAVRKVREAVMAANAAIACEGK